MGAFQIAIGYQQPYGIVGARAFDGPYRVRPGFLNSADPTLNVVGRAAQFLSGATGSFPVAGDNGANPKPVLAGVGAGAGARFAGLIVDPHQYVNFGTSVGGPLAPTMVLPNGTPVSLATEGDWNIALGAASNPEDVVYFNHATGVLVTTAPGAAQPANTIGPIGTIERFVNAAASIAVVHLEPMVPLPPAA